MELYITEQGDLINSDDYIDGQPNDLKMDVEGEYLFPTGLFLNDTFCDITLSTSHPTMLVSILAYLNLKKTNVKIIGENLDDNIDPLKPYKRRLRLLWGYLKYYFRNYNLLTKQQERGGDITGDTTGFATVGSVTTPTISYITTDHNDGLGCIKVLSTSDNNTISLKLMNGATQYYPIVGGGTYVLSSYIKNNTTPLINGYVRIYWFDNAKGSISNQLSSYDSTPLSWSKSEVVVEAPENAAYCVLYISSKVNTNDYMLCDTIKFRKISIGD